MLKQPLKQGANMTSSGGSDGGSSYFTKLYRCLGPRVLAYFRRKVNQMEIAEDLTVEVFERLWEYLQTHGPPQNPVAFIYTMARNRYVDHLRREHTQKAYLVGMSAEDPGPPSDPVVEVMHALKQLEALMAGIDDRDRQLLALRYGLLSFGALEDRMWSFQAVAQEMTRRTSEDWTEERARKACHRALQKLVTKARLLSSSKKRR